MHMRVSPLRLAACLAAAAVALGTTQAQAASVERASIIPLVNQFIGGAVNSLPGYSLYANGISDYWATASSATVSFAIFVFPGRQVTQDIGFSVLPPSGQTPVYSYTFKQQNILPIGTWYTVGAVGDFSKEGVYNAIVTANGQEIGRIPVVFTAPTR
jgi:hypothetical protein